MVVIEQVIYVLPILGLTASILYYAMILRNTNKARQRELIFLKAQTTSLEFSKIYAEVTNMTDWSNATEWRTKYGLRDNPDDWAKIYYIRNIFNTAGLLLKEKEADADLIFQLYVPNSIIPLWEQFEPLVHMTREWHGYPDHWKPFEFLYNEAKKRYPNISQKRIMQPPKE